MPRGRHTGPLSCASARLRGDEVIFESEDIKARRRAADTGPIHYYPTNNPD